MLFGIAICGNPDLLFLDEPTVGLDVEARRLMWSQIRTLIARGKTVLLTTHCLPVRVIILTTFASAGYLRRALASRASRSARD